MKSIIYSPHIPEAKQQTDALDVKPFNYTGYRPTYKWTPPIQETPAPETPAQETPAQTQTITFEDPSTIVWPDQTPISATIQSQTQSRARGSHIFKSDDIDVGEMQELLDQFADAGILLRITSGRRKGAKTKQGRTSHHSTGRALDITPVEGQTFEDLARQIRNAPKLVQYMREHGYGIYDETTPEVLEKTGGTGPHWHIGPDQNALKGLEIILQGKHGMKLPTILNKNKGA